jgi:hypothetical protein
MPQNLYVREMLALAITYSISGGHDLMFLLLICNGQCKECCRKWRLYTVLQYCRPQTCREISSYHEISHHPTTMRRHMAATAGDEAADLIEAGSNVTSLHAAKTIARQESRLVCIHEHKQTSDTVAHLACMLDTMLEVRTIEFGCNTIQLLSFDSHSCMLYSCTCTYKRELNKTRCTSDFLVTKSFAKFTPPPPDFVTRRR